MPFEFLPLLEQMKGFYELPRDRQRFDTYLDMLVGPNRKDIVLPIASFNPMGKDVVLDKIDELQDLEAESLMAAVVRKINLKPFGAFVPTITVALNLVDDIGGAWSNHSTTDYTSKFDNLGMLKRNFCLPYFWTSEEYSAEEIRRRTEEDLYRAIYGLTNGKPESLQQHLEQEVFVQEQTSVMVPDRMDESEAQEMERLLAQHGPETTDYNTIFNFFYGDAACEVLNYPCYGVSDMAGFRYAAYLTKQ